MTPLEKKLARRIHNQRVRLRWFESMHTSWGSHWRHNALAYRKQLQDAGIKPESIWSATYRKETKK